MFSKLLLATALTATPALADETRAFDMMTLTTSQAYSGEMMVAGKKCKLKGTGEESCSRFGGTRIGTVLIMNFTTQFNNGRLFAVSGGTTIAYALDLKNAFVAKYGEPFSITTEPWQNQMGATIENRVARWRFSDGVLELRARGSNRDFTEFSFVAMGNGPQGQGQPVNF